MVYGQPEPGWGFKQLVNQKKGTGVGSGGNFGDTLSMDKVTGLWTKAVAGSRKPFGFIGNSIILTHTIDVLTGVNTTTRGVTDAEDNLSVIVAGRIEKIAEGAIAYGALVMPGATNPVTHVKIWDGVNPDAVIGRYVINRTQFHHVNVQGPAAANNDRIVLEILEGTVT